MLVLSRKIGERIIINDNIVLVVLAVEKGKVKLGIEAPKEMPIFKKELLDFQPKDVKY